MIKPPVPSLVTVTGPLLDGPTAGLVTGNLAGPAGDDGAVSVIVFPPGTLGRSITPVYPSGHPGAGYRYVGVALWVVVLADADAPELVEDPGEPA